MLTPLTRPPLLSIWLLHFTPWFNKWTFLFEQLPLLDWPVRICPERHILLIFQVSTTLAFFHFLESYTISCPTFSICVVFFSTLPTLLPLPWLPMHRIRLMITFGWWHSSLVHSWCPLLILTIQWTSSNPRARAEPVTYVYLHVPCLLHPAASPTKDILILNVRFIICSLFLFCFLFA